MPSNATAAQLLAEHILGRPILDYIREKREVVPIWSWRLIAKQIAVDTDGRVTVTHDTLRLWYAESLGEQSDLNAAV